MKKIILLSYLILCCLAAKSQVYPPTFKCIQNDTLRWDAAQNACGTFQSYLIYASQKRTGPYVQIALLTDPAAVSFYHNKPVNTGYFYFMQSRFDCPGQPIINSDTLDSTPPVTPKIQAVSVENNKIQIEWEKINDPRIAAYIIYRVTPLGIKPIDTVFSSTKFTDAGVNPDKNRETYYVLALDRCNSTSIFGGAHTSIALNVTQDECEQSAIMKWNRYKDWTAGALRHEIWVKQGNKAYAKVDTTSGMDTTYTFKGLKNQEKYCFYVKAVQKENPKYAAKTNEFCLTGSVLKSTEFVIVNNIEVDKNGIVTFNWQWNNDADLDSIKIKRAIDGKIFREIATLSNKNYASDISFTDKTPIGKEKEYYGIYSLDICKNFVFAPFYTLNTAAEAIDNRSNKITWTDHHVKTPTTTYELYRVTKSGEKKVWETTNKNEFIDPFDPLDPDNGEICYYTVAYAFDTLPNKKPIKVRSKSNTVCVAQSTSVFLPNAFSPRGINQEFRALVSFDDMIATFDMIVIDRFGARVFETKDWRDAWNGKINNSGSDAPQGTYTYQVKLVQTNGKEIIKRGTLMLLR